MIDPLFQITLERLLGALVLNLGFLVAFYLWGYRNGWNASERANGCEAKIAERFRREAMKGDTK